MATLLLLTNDMRSSAEILPALELLPTTSKSPKPKPPRCWMHRPDVILLDARRDLVGARSLCRLIETTGKEAPLLVIAHEGGLAALSADWGFDDLARDRRPAEVDVRLRLAMTPSVATNVDPVIQSGNIMIDEAGYSASSMVSARSHLHRVRAVEVPRSTGTCSAAAAMSDVWGYDYYGGTRTVDVHVRGLRASSARSTSRSSARFATGYRFVTPAEESARLTG